MLPKPAPLPTTVRWLLIASLLVWSQVEVPLAGFQAFECSASLLLASGHPEPAPAPPSDSILVAAWEGLQSLTNAGSRMVGQVLTPRSFRVVAVESSRGPASFLWPVQGGISSGYGMRRHPVTRRRSFHAAIDILAPRGTPIRSPADGRVEAVCRAGAMGRLVRIRTNNGLELLFGHLSGFRCQVGQRVRRGQVIGLVGSTGRTTGPHLHFAIRHGSRRYLNPLSFLGRRAAANP